MSLIDKLKAGSRQAHGCIEILDSERDFKLIRSKLLLASLLRLGDVERNRADTIFNYFSSRRVLELSSEDAGDFGPVFDINDMIQAVGEGGRRVGDLLGEVEFFADLERTFKAICCDQSGCELQKTSAESIANSIDSDHSDIAFIGPLYLSGESKDRDAQSIVWAFREARQSGVRRFYIDGKVKVYPTLESGDLESEILDLGSPRIFIPLRRSFNNLESKKELKRFIDDSIVENKALDSRILCFLVGKLQESEVDIREILPLSSTAYCKKCELAITEKSIGEFEQVFLNSEKSQKKIFSKKVLGLLVSQLRDLTFEELFRKIDREESEFHFAELWEILKVKEFSQVKLSHLYADLSLFLKLLLQLELIKVAKISGAIFLLELLEAEYLKNQDLLLKSLESLKNAGNSLLLCVLREDRSSFSVEPFSEFVLRDFNSSPMIVDLLNLRSKILNIYSATKQARLMGFDSGNFNKKQFLCEACNGIGYFRKELSYGYIAVENCDDCVGTAFTKDIRKLTCYGLSMEECFQGSLRDLVEQFSVEPGFISSEASELYAKLGEKFKINTLINALGPKDREIFANIIQI